MHQVILKKTPAPTYLICQQAPVFSWSNKNIFSPGGGGDAGYLESDTSNWEI